MTTRNELLEETRKRWRDEISRENRRKLWRQAWDGFVGLVFSSAIIAVVFYVAFKHFG